MRNDKNTARYFILIGVIVLFFIACVVRLTQLQIVSGADFREQSERRLIRALPIKAPRGEILDRYGRELVTNRMGFFIKIQKLDIPREELFEVINNLVKIAKEENVSYIESFPITSPP